MINIRYFIIWYCKRDDFIVSKQILYSHLKDHRSDDSLWFWNGTHCGYIQYNTVNTVTTQSHQVTFAHHTHQQSYKTHQINTEVKHGTQCSVSKHYAV